ncbi:MAG: hypothetical protein HRT73_13340 [Flavobacteriales bacterium]|nr:hypothetical protein [Flavobacteriales bacterium]NQX98843.1 hypothetical protein [Flavobacteriales bacterium]
MKTFLLTILLITSTYILAGGPWLEKKKSGYFQFQTTLPVTSYNRLFLSGNKQLDLNRSAIDINFQAYLEYGITDQLNLIAVLPFKYISTGSEQSQLTNPTLLPNGNLSGIGNYKIALKQQILNKKLKVAVSLQSSFKPINHVLEKGLITGYNANSIGLYTHIGKSFSKRTYSFIEGGFNTVSNDFSDFYEIHYEIGYQFKNSVWGAFTLDLRESLRNGSYRNENLRQTGFYTNDQEYFSFGFKSSYELKTKLGFSAAVFGAFTGNYVAYMTTFSLGIYKKW